MGLSYYLEEQIHDESASLLDDDNPLRGFGGKERALPMGIDLGNVAESGKRVSNNLIEHWKGLTPLAKVALVITAVVLYFWSGVSSKRQPDVVGHKQLSDLDELNWAEQTFGIFLEDAVPRLEKANSDAHHFLNMLPEGQCDAWSAIFAETGKFSFNIPQLKADFTTRKEVRDAFCSSVGKRIAAMRLIWHFPDTERGSGVALFEVFTRDAPGAEVQKARWALFASLGIPPGGKGVQILEYQCFTESVGASLDGPLGAAVSANLRRLNGHDCEGFAGALPGQGTANWVMQSLPLGKSERDELDDKPQNLLLEKCRRDTEKDWSKIDLQYSSVAGVFPSANLDEAIIFFHKEKRYKGTVDVTDDPEALVVKKAPGKETQVVNREPWTELPKAPTFYFFFIEAVHIAEEWSWKYGWEAKQRGAAGK